MKPEREAEIREELHIAIRDGSGLSAGAAYCEELLADLDRLRAELSAVRDQWGEALDETQRLRSENDRLRAGVRETLAVLTDMTLQDSNWVKKQAAVYVLHALLEAREG